LKAWKDTIGNILDKYLKHPNNDIFMKGAEAHSPETIHEWFKTVPNVANITNKNILSHCRLFKRDRQDSEGKEIPWKWKNLTRWVGEKLEEAREYFKSGEEQREIMEWQRQDWSFELLDNTQSASQGSEIPRIGEACTDEMECLRGFRGSAVR